jgi:hypothetical protein
LNQSALKEGLDVRAGGSAAAGCFQIISPSDQPAYASGDRIASAQQIARAPVAWPPLVQIALTVSELRH